MQSSKSIVQDFTVSQSIFVVGATGFVGKFLTAQLLQQGYPVFALVRNVSAQAQGLTEWLRQRGVSVEKLILIQGDVTKKDLGVSKADWERLKCVTRLFNCAAWFAWDLTMQQAQAVNVFGAVNLLRCVGEHCQLQRAVHVSGYMLTLTEHLQEVGICLDDIDATDWVQVYTRLGAYEASKIQAHFAWIKQADSQALDWSIIHPATVTGDMHTGEIPLSQAIAQMITALKRGKMMAIPATAIHYLPLVNINYLVAVMAEAGMDPQMRNQALLVADEEQIPLHQLLHLMATQLKLSAPKHYVPLWFLQWLLKWRWLAQKMEMSAEMLHFLRTEVLDRSKLVELEQQWKLKAADVETVIAKTTLWVDQQTSDA